MAGCSARLNNLYVGLDLADRAYFKAARDTRNFVLSDFLLAKPTGTPIVMAAYPVSAINSEADSMILAAISLDWMASIMSNLAGRPGLSAVLIDSAGTVMAAPPDQASTVGRPLDNIPLLSAIAEKALTSDAPDGLAFFHRRGRLNAIAQFCAHSRNAIASARQCRRGQGDGGDQSRDTHCLSRSSASSACSCCSARWSARKNSSSIRSNS